ncbi:taurine dioxygenase [Rhodobacteraceae bacterium HTCC2150]|nr:taurine dioxygenase [Rhodobacteraceae bacterium HTCC2150]
MFKLATSAISLLLLETSKNDATTFGAALAAATVFDDLTLDRVDVFVLDFGVTMIRLFRLFIFIVHE